MAARAALVFDAPPADAVHVIQEPAKAQKVLEVFAQRPPAGANPR